MEINWAPTKALGRAVLITGVLTLLAVLLGRIDLVVLAAPFAVGTSLALRRRPLPGPALSIALPASAAAEGEQTQATVALTNPSRVRFDLAVLRLSHSPWLRFVHGDRPVATDLGAGKTNELQLRGAALRWGHHQVGPARTYAVACGGLLLSAPMATPGLEVRVHPKMPAFRAEDTMPRSSALVGVHRSRLAGQGGELAGVRRYSPGDRLRRVDWRVTLRTRELHVAHTLSDRDAEVVVLLDVLHEAGTSGGVHGMASVVDTTVRAAAAITEYYLRQGDRVALLEYSGHPRHLPAATGRRQLQVALEWLLHTRASEGAGDPPSFGIDPHLAAPTALVVVLTPLLAPQSSQMIAILARAGRVVVAVDTLGENEKRRPIRSQWTEVGQRLWRLERENTIGALREVGVPVTPWVGSGSLDQVLRDMMHMASAPRIVIR